MKKRAFFYIIFAGILWGTSVIFVNLLAPLGFSSLQMTFARALVSFICIFTYAMVKDRSIFKVTKKQLALNVAAGASFFVTATSYYFAMQETSPSTAVVLMYLAPIIVLAYSVLFLGEKLTGLKSLSIMAMLAGCAFVSGACSGLVFKPLGLAFGFLSGISYALYNIFAKISTKNECKPITITLYCFMTATVISFFTSDAFAMSAIMEGNALLCIALLVLMGICTCVMPYFLYNLGMKELPAGTATALGIVEPMSATVLSVVIFGERLEFFPLIGIILILASTIVLSKSDN